MNRRAFLRALPALGVGLTALVARVNARRFMDMDTVLGPRRQRFVPCLEGADHVTVDFVDVSLARHGRVTGRVWITLETRWGFPVCVGAAPCVTDKVDLELLPGSPTYVRFVFRRGAPTLRCGEPYYMTLRSGAVVSSAAGLRVYARRPIDARTASWFWVVDARTGKRLYAVHRETSAYMFNDGYNDDSGWQEVAVVRRPDGAPKLKLCHAYDYRLEPISPEYARVA